MPRLKFFRNWADSYCTWAMDPPRTTIGCPVKAPALGCSNPKHHAASADPKLSLHERAIHPIPGDGAFFFVNFRPKPHKKAYETARKSLAARSGGPRRELQG